MILAGGESRRFGGKPKGLQEVAGRRIIDRVADALRWVTPNLVLAANSTDASDWLPGVAVLPDRLENRGGLAGIDAAMANGGDLIVVAWDMPFVTADVLQLILATARKTDADVVVPESNSPNGFEPFCAFYSAAVAARLAAFLASRSAPSEFLAEVDAVRVPKSAIAEIDDPDRLFFSVNSAADLMYARTKAGDAQ